MRGSGVINHIMKKLICLLLFVFTLGLFVPAAQAAVTVSTLSSGGTRSVKRVQSHRKARTAHKRHHQARKKSAHHAPKAPGVQK
jgi:hypothetical protein